MLTRKDFRSIELAFDCAEGKLEGQILIRKLLVKANAEIGFDSRLTTWLASGDREALQRLCDEATGWQGQDSYQRAVEAIHNAWMTAKIHHLETDFAIER